MSLSLPSSCRFALAACLPVLLAACASASGPVEWNLMGRTTAEWADPAALVSRIAAVGGVPVAPEVNSVAPGWVAFTLRCDNRTACKRAMMKLAAEPALFAELRRDEQRHTPSRPPASLSR